MSRSAFTSVTDGVLRATNKLTKGTPSSGNDTVQTHIPFSPHVAYPAAGSIAQIDFFQVGPLPFICNFPGIGGMLPSNYTYAAVAVGITLIPGVDTTGARVAASNES